MECSVNVYITKIIIFLNITKMHFLNVEKHSGNISKLFLEYIF